MPESTPNVPGEAFGPWLRRQLQRADMSQADLADRVGKTRAAVSAWVTGRAEPREETKVRIAEILGTDLASVVTRTCDVSGSRPVRWHHRRAYADGGREYGNAAAFAFEADLAVLAREATQNSLDERLDDRRPVRVHYTLHELDGPYLDAFLSALRWDDVLPHFREAARGGQKVSRSLRSALGDLAQERRLRLLRVEDYNAAGLTGPEYGDGRFAAVVRRQLDSHKVTGGRAGGSYGLGKATLWATSRFGLVLINSTLSEPHEGRTTGRVIGRLDLPWHEVDGESYAGPAWLGEPDTEPEHKGISRSWWADDETLRRLHLDRTDDEPGTSFLIVGAYDASGATESLQDMHDKLVSSLADDFWAAMIGGRSAGPLLEARVTTLRNGETYIPEQQVDPYSRHPATSRALQAYLDGDTVEELTSADQVVRADVPLVVTPLKGQGHSRDKGREHLAVLLVTPADDNDTQFNRVVCMRGNRMTITEQRPRDLPLGTPPFQAVLLAGYATGREGDDVALAEAFLRASEPPEHDRWDRTQELTTAYERGALSRLKEFRTSIDKTVRSLLGKREITTTGGPAALRELLKLDMGTGGGARRAHSFPTVRNIDARVDDRGAWHVTVQLRLPDGDDRWVLAPVAKFDVRSGGRPSVGWELLVGSETCRAENGLIIVEPGVRSAVFDGVTDPSTHPVRSGYARLTVDLPRARGGSA
ncbi:helix-turn-helix domain-containing protein [Streptomyces glaucescens]|uniref:Helix-turn-helix family protein n=1 Tax=Streptomyces glaucescens TaxID=1907 RepID=A0A089X5X8_STRGA|nr:helix-turn-helix domain-containing protein [Streptomyces glaucescens]AIR98588.1 helix-turn-helix family protein [Streptomyces glaucescens]